MNLTILPRPGLRWMHQAITGSERGYWMAARWRIHRAESSGRGMCQGAPRNWSQDAECHCQERSDEAISIPWGARLLRPARNTMPKCGFEIVSEGKGRTRAESTLLHRVWISETHPSHSRGTPAMPGSSHTATRSPPPSRAPRINRSAACESPPPAAEDSDGLASPHRQSETRRPSTNRSRPGPCRNSFSHW